MKRWALITAIPLSGIYGGLAPANSATLRDVFAAPAGLQLMDQVAKLYGAMPGANQTVSQWSIPKKLASFSRDPQTGLYETENKYASVTYNADGSVTLSQNGHFLPCQKQYAGGMQVDEFDLFLSPSRPTLAMPLSKLSHVYVGGTVSATGTTVFGTACALNVGVVVDAIVFSNTKTQQVLYYQVKLASFGANGKALEPTSRPSWFATGKNKQTMQGNTYGFDTQIWSDFGLAPLQPNIATTYNFDVLPKLKQVIVNGATYGMDQNLADWAVSGRYTGSSIFGRTGIQVRLKNLSLKVQ